MTRDQAFPSKYLKAADLKGKPCIVTIESAPFEMLKGLDGEEQHKTVLHFKGSEKMMPLNSTNWDSVAEITGCPDSDDWPGKRIELYPTKTHLGGKQVDCIRIRMPSNGLQAAPRRMSATEQQPQWKSSSGPPPLRPGHDNVGIGYGAG